MATDYDSLPTDIVGDDERFDPSDHAGHHNLVHTHAQDEDNPHNTTAAQVGAEPSGTVESHRTGEVHTDPQPPQAHGLGGAEHSADTLANLNAKVSDATLDDASATRPPSSHGNEAHGTNFAPESHDHSITDDTTGTLPVNRGGTGGTSASDARSNLGAVSSSEASFHEYYQGTGTNSSITVNFSQNSPQFLWSSRSGSLSISWSNTSGDPKSITLTMDLVTSITWPHGTRFIGGEPPPAPDGTTWYECVAYFGNVTVFQIATGISS